MKIIQAPEYTKSDTSPVITLYPSTGNAVAPVANVVFCLSAAAFFF